MEFTDFKGDAVESAGGGAAITPDRVPELAQVDEVLRIGVFFGQEDLVNQGEAFFGKGR